MSVNCIVHLVLHFCKKLLCCFRCSVIIKSCSIDICYLLIKSTLRETDFSNLLKQMVEIFYCEHRANIFQAFIIHDSTFDGVVLYDAIGSLAKLYCSLIINLESNRNNHLKIILLCSFIVGKPTSYNVLIILCVSHIFSSS